MKTIEEIEKEYETFQIKSTNIDTLKKFIAFISDGIGTIDEEKRIIATELKTNKKMQLEAKIRNFFFFIFEEEDVDFYDEDNIILDEMLDFILTYEAYFLRIKELAAEDNFSELTRLVDFATKYYNENIDYLENKRDALEYIYKGISYYNMSQEDYREVFREFIEKKLAEFKTSKAVEKIKKLW